MRIISIDFQNFNDRKAFRFFVLRSAQALVSRFIVAAAAAAGAVNSKKQLF